MNKDWARFRTLSVILSIVLTGWGDVGAVSRQVFPGLDERDLPFYLDKQHQIWDQNLYVFSTLSLLSLRKDSIVFDLSKYSAIHVIPLIVLNIYPESRTRIKSEFFDFTIWGQLGNYFNKNIEIIKIENEIISILYEIEELNKRYKELMELIGPYQIEKEKIITIDKMNFIFFDKGGISEPSNEEKVESQQSENTHETKTVDDLIRRYESESRQDRLKAGPHLRTPPPGMFDTAPSEAAYIRFTQAARALEPADPEVDSFIFRLFNTMSAILRYVRQNRLEALIYLSLVLLVGSFIKVLFAR